VWSRVAQALQHEADLEELFIDSTVVRTHQHASGAPKNGGDQAIGRSRGGLTTKIHACCRCIGQSHSLDSDRRKCR